MLNPKKGAKKVNVAILIIAVILIALFVLLQKKPIFEKKEIVKVAFMGDFSNDKSTTESALTAVKIAVEDMNRIYNKKYELVVYDVNKNSKADVENAFKRAGNENVLAIISKFNPANNPANEKIPTIYIGGTKKESTKREKFYWGIRLFFIASDYVDQHFKLIKLRYNISSAAFIADNQDWLSDDFMKNVESFNGIKLSTYRFNRTKIPEITNDIKQKNPDTVMLLTSDGRATSFLRKAKEDGLNNNLFLVFATTNVSFLILEDSIPERIIIAPPPADKLGPIEEVKDAFGEFNRRVFLLTNSTATNLQLDAYDAVSLIAYTASSISATSNPETIKQERQKFIEELWGIKQFASLKGSLTPNGKTGYFERTHVNTFYIEDARFKSAKDVII